VRTAIEQELRRIEETAMYGAQMQFEQTKFWRSVNLSLGIPASVLAAASGATALAVTTGRIAAGIVALVAAAFGGVLTTVNASSRMNTAGNAATGYLAIQVAARQLRAIDLPHEPVAATRAALAELTDKLDEQNRAAEPPTGRSYRKARRNIESGGQSYAVDAPD
jgi:hypothetical protein